MVAAIVIRTINIAVAAPTTVAAASIAVARRWPEAARSSEVALLPEAARPSEVAPLGGAEPQSVAEVDAVVDTNKRASLRALGARPAAQRERA
jgi:hypothetical protein